MSTDDEGERPGEEGPEGQKRRAFFRGRLHQGRELLESVLDGSERARSETLRAVSREFRSYLDDLGLPELMHNIVTNYSLEIRASIHLKPLKEKASKERGEEKTAEPG